MKKVNLKKYLFKPYHGGGFLQKFALWVFRIFVLFLFLNFFLFLFFQIPSVQRKATNYITSFLESRSGTKVELASVRFNFFNNFELRGFSIDDLHANPVIYAQQLQINFSVNPVNLYRQRIVLDEVVLKNAGVNLRKYPGETEQNIDLLIRKMFPPKEDKKKSDTKLKLIIKTIQLAVVEFTDYNEHNGNYLSISTQRGEAKVGKMDFVNKEYIFSSVIFDMPVFRLQYRKLSMEAIEASGKVIKETDNPNGKVLKLVFQDFELNDGSLFVDNYQRPPDPNIKISVDDIDWSHFAFNDVHAIGKNLIIHDGSYSASPLKISLKESKGFEIKELTAGFAGINNEQIRLAELNLQTKASVIRDSVILNYESLSSLSDDFANNVGIKIGLNKSMISVREIAHFAPSLKYDKFFVNNFNEVLTVSGEIYGRINSLKAKNLIVEIPSKLYLHTEFKSNDISQTDNAIINLDIKQLNSNVQFLEKAIPNLVLPPNFSKLGELSFKGNFDGFFTDFVTYGTLKTNLGDIGLDLRMNLQNGKDNSIYSGGMKLKNFNLGSWIDQNKFGNLSADFNVRNGHGFTADKAEADLDGKVHSIEYNSYTYHDIVLNGIFKKNTIDGSITGSDPNADFTFTGKVDLGADIPEYDFLSEIKNLDLYKLNLSSKPLAVSGNLDINLLTRNFKTLDGTSKINNLRFTNGQKTLFELDEILLNASQTGNVKTIDVKSDVADVYISGEFEIDNLHQIFLQNLKKLYPRYYDDIKLPKVNLPFTRTQCSYKFDIKKTEPLLALIDNPVSFDGPLLVSGKFNNLTNQWNTLATTEGIKVGDKVFKGITINYIQYDEEANFSGILDKTVVMDKVLDNTRFTFVINPENIKFDFNGIKLYSSDLSVNGTLKPTDDGYNLHFNNNSINLLGENWEVNPDNLLKINKQTIIPESFVLTNENRQIILNQTINDGLEFAIIGYDVSKLNEIIKYDKLKLSGNLQIYARVNEVYKLRNFGLRVYSDSLNINKDHWGKLLVNASAIDFKELLNVEYQLEHDTIAMSGRGFLNISDRENIRLKLDNRFNYLPLRTLEYFIGNGINNTSGSLKGNFTVEGPLHNMGLSGKADIAKAGFHLIYTNVDYTIENGKVAFSNTKIDATGSYITDPLGNKALVTGGLVHDHFKKWGYDVKIQSPEFIALNTSVLNNNIYYGKGVGAILMTIGGTFGNTNMYINATTAKGSNLTIPFGSTEQAKASGFVRFVNKNVDTSRTNAEKRKPAESSGLNIDMDLSVTEDALIQLILDPKAGDYIKGYGKGNIQLAFSSTGEFNMFGDYEIVSGEYLFTLLNLVNKPFNISGGSTVRWTGDPYEGEVNLTASYRDLYTSPYNFILEYLGADNNAITEARKTTKVDLDLSLSGRLLSPNIKLDINFPNISPIIRNYVDSKLRIVRQDQNEMNRQAMALIVTKSFIPPNNNFQGTQYLTSINTLSELMSNQLSGYITELLSDFIKENGVISGIDLKVGYNVYDASTVNPFSTSELQLRMKNNLFSDRLSINIGGNVGTNASSAVSSQTYFAGDLEVTYSITPDNRLKIRAYQRTEPSLEGGRKNKSGIGISYRREFNNFSEVITDLKSGILKKKDLTKSN